MAYQTLKLLKPWKPALKAQLKDKHGFLLSPANELKELGQYATQVFAARGADRTHAATGACQAG